MFKHDIYGDDVMFIVVNVSCGWYVYTYEDLNYTIHNICNEYEITPIDMLDMEEWYDRLRRKLQKLPCMAHTPWAIARV